MLKNISCLKIKSIPRQRIVWQLFGLMRAASHFGHYHLFIFR